MASSSITTKVRRAASFLDAFSLSLKRRGCASATNLENKGPKAVQTAEKAEKETVVTQASMWVPHPVTGFYEPSDRKIEADAADLRGEMALKHNIKSR